MHGTICNNIRALQLRKQTSTAREMQKSFKLRHNGITDTLVVQRNFMLVILKRKNLKIL